MGGEPREPILEAHFAPFTGTNLERLSMIDLERVLGSSWRQELWDMDMESKSENTASKSCRGDTGDLIESASENVTPKPRRRDAADLNVTTGSICITSAVREAQQDANKENIESARCAIRAREIVS
ncbi:hypothetical protein E2P81_ATG00789 [Venturia nashicola]|nr:hypothetical protein E2P81_ATG00789 [Venturia nashicola]